MILKIFTQPACSNCPSAKKLGEELEEEKHDGLKIEWYNVAEIDGLSEGAFYSVMSTPSFVLVNDEGSEVASWRGRTPLKEEISKQIQ